MQNFQSGSCYWYHCMYWCQRGWWWLNSLNLSRTSSCMRWLNIGLFTFSDWCRWYRKSYWGFKKFFTVNSVLLPNVIQLFHYVSVLKNHILMMLDNMMYYKKYSIHLKSFGIWSLLSTYSEIDIQIFVLYCSLQIHPKESRTMTMKKMIMKMNLNDNVKYVHWQNPVLWKER